MWLTGSGTNRTWSTWRRGGKKANPGKENAKINSQSLRRHASRVHFAKIHFGKINFGGTHFEKIHFGDGVDLLGDRGNLLSDGGDLLGDGVDLLDNGGDLLGDGVNLFVYGVDLLGDGGDLLGDVTFFTLTHCEACKFYTQKCGNLTKMPRDKTA